MKCESVHKERMKVLTACIFLAGPALSQRENEELTFSMIVGPIRG